MRVVLAFLANGAAYLNKLKFNLNMLQLQILYSDHYQIHTIR